MFFNFKLFSQDVQAVYMAFEDYPFELKEVLGIFEMYFESYEREMNQTHPFITRTAIFKILEDMPFVCDRHYDRFINLNVDDYRLIIDRHFQTVYKFCDFNIIHFFSGRIRLLRFYESSGREICDQK